LLAGIDIYGRNKQQEASGMEKMQMRSKDMIQGNLEKIGELFPGSVVEATDASGKVRKKINMDYLRQFLSPEVLEGDEVYEMTWVGKKASIVDANTPVTKTLRPDIDKSVEWDTTGNLYIEGDNLEVLKLLQESYLEKVKIIYIDPPYNTGSDFIYRDNFDLTSDEYEQSMGVYNENQEKLFKNTDTNGRFHSDWCSMIYSRLLLARNLLSEDGVIFISIDDREQENLKKICNEIFGENNFIAQVVWERAFSPVNLKKHFSESHDFILCYAKKTDRAVCNGLPRSNDSDARYSNPDNDPRGPWTSGDLSVGPASQSRIYEITTPSGRKVLPPGGYCWRLDQDTFEQYKRENRIWFGEAGDNVPRIKRFLSDVKQGITPMTIWKYTDVGSSQDATRELKKIFDGKAFFDYPKPVSLIKRCIQLYEDKDCLVMDFFSGSATTAQAVMELNAEDNGGRRFIMVQCAEATKEKGEAYREGYKTICDIGEERIRRAGRQLKEKNHNMDAGFRVFYLDESNMTDVYYAAEDYTQDLLAGLESNVKADRTAEDLLFGCLIDWGLPLSLPYRKEQIEGFQVLIYNDGDLIACFDEDISDALIKKIAERRPVRAVFRDGGFADSPSKMNVDEIFKLLAPDTRVKVI